MQTESLLYSDLYQIKVQKDNVVLNVPHQLHNTTPRAQSAQPARPARPAMTIPSKTSLAKPNKQIPKGFGEVTFDSAGKIASTAHFQPQPVQSLQSPKQLTAGFGEVIFDSEGRLAQTPTAVIPAPRRRSVSNVNNDYKKGLQQQDLCLFAW
eukprot:Awhi_evm1s11914